MSITNYYAGFLFGGFGDLELSTADNLATMRRGYFQYYGGGRNEGKSWNSPQNPPQETPSFKRGDFVRVVGHEDVHKVIGQQNLPGLGYYVLLEGGRLEPAEHLRKVELKELSEYE